MTNTRFSDCELLLCGLLCLSFLVVPLRGHSITQGTGADDATEVLALEQKIEETVVKGDVEFAQAVLSSDFHFRHGDGWTRGEKVGGRR
jgi:hypothetical protein